MSNDIDILIDTGKKQNVSVEMEKAYNYEYLSKKPRINGVELFGDKTPEELGIGTSDVSHLATKEELSDGLGTKQDKGDYALKSELPKVPSKVSAFENDAGYLKEHQDISGLATKKELSDGLDTKQEKGDYATKDEISGKQDVIADLSTIRSSASKGATAVQPNQLSAVATSGNYSDLNGKPTIPTKTSELDNDSGFIKEVPVKDVQAYGTSVVQDGVANIPLANTNNLPGVVRTSSDQGITLNGPYLKLVQATTAQVEAKTSDRLAITPANLDTAVKTGITTNTTELTDEEKTNACNWVGAGQKRTTVIDSTTPTVTIDNALSNTDYQYGTITSLTITAVENSYLETNFFFTAGSEITVDLPDTLKIIGSPLFEANKQYAMSICNNTLIVGIIS